MRRWIVAAGAWLVAGCAWAAPPVALTEMTSSRALPNGIEVTAGGATLRVTAVADGVARVQAVGDGPIPPDRSFAVLPQAAPAVTARAAGFSAANLDVSVAAAPLGLRIADAAGRVLLQTAPDRPITFRDGGFEAWLALPAGQAAFGLGDKAGPLNRRGRAFVDWNTDATHYGDASDPLYKSIPFLLAQGRDAARGLFLDNTWRSHFDVGLTQQDALGLGAAGGALDLYVIAGPEPKAVLARYADLTGHMPLPPLWALGFQQSRWSYDSQARVEAVVASYRAAAIPLDAIWLDIDYQDRHRPFTVNRAAFPDLPGMVRRLGAQGVRVVAITDLHVAAAEGEGYAPFDSGVAGDHFIRRADGARYVGAVWPGASVFPEFARATTRAWWGGLYRDFYLGAGIAGFWNDMNEPTVFDGPGKTMPADLPLRLDGGAVASHAELHNVYGMLNARATADGLRALAPDRRSFVLTRATYAGGQRDAAVWTGDNSSTWEHLRLSVPQLASLGVSGFPLAGADVGGFSGSPTPELLTRWIEVAAFTPLMRDHTEAGTRDQEAYVGDPAQVARRRAAIAARYRLMPYLYALAEEAARTGVPMLRPLALEYPAAGLDWVDGEFLLGPDLLVAPPPEHRPDGFQAVLPPGVAWFDYWTGRRFAGDAFTPEADRIPALARAGAIIPHAPLAQSTAQPPRGHLDLRVYPGPDCRGEVYADDGATLAYARGAFFRQGFACREAADGWHLTARPGQGGFAPWWDGIDVTVFGQDAPPRAVERDGAPLAFAYDPASLSVRLTLPAASSGAEVRLAR